MKTKLFIAVISMISSTQVMAQANELKCFVSAKLGEEIELPKNEMQTPKGFPHLKGQSFQKVVKLQDKSTADIIFTLRGKSGKTFDFRINSSNLMDSLHITAALDDQNMFQYTNYATGVAVKCTSDY
jgi:hypothetical protein